jgi:UDP-glucose 4-epimerase
VIVPGSRRILIIGAASWLGARLAQRLELDPRIERVVGVDSVPPSHQLGRTEFVRLPDGPGQLAEILRVGQIDTVVEARPPEPANTQGLVGALEAAPDAVGKLVLRSSAHYYGYRAGAPAFLTEDVVRSPMSGAGTTQQVIQAEAGAWRFAARHPQRTVTILRLAQEVGAATDGPHMRLLGLPAIPSILGFDPRWQLVEEHDAVGAVTHAVVRELPGVYNVAADGVLALSEIASLLGKPMVPVLPPLGLGRALSALQRVGLTGLTELHDGLRLGRGLDNRRFKATGFSYRYTTREAVSRLGDRQRQRGAPPRLQGSLQDR